MATITLPIWALTAAVGLPATCLIWIVARLIRRRRKAARALASQPVHQAPGMSAGASQFRDDLLAQQIDIVFNGLSALIETERIKLRSLFSQRLPQPGHFQSPATPSEDVPAPARKVPAPQEDQSNPIGQLVAEAMAAGRNADDIAAELGLSHAEVLLAMKLQQTRDAAPYRKLEAVA